MEHINLNWLRKLLTTITAQGIYTLVIDLMQGNREPFVWSVLSVVLTLMFAKAIQRIHSGDSIIALF